MTMRRFASQGITSPSRRYRVKQAQEEKTPGQVGDKLRRKMGDALADIFSEAGTKLYADAVLELKSDLERMLTEGISTIEGTIKEELGNRGLEHASELFKPWINEVVEEIVSFGLAEISGGLEDLASSAAAEFSKKPLEDDESEDALLGMEDEEEPLEEVETVEEEPVEAPVEEAPVEGGDVAGGGEVAIPGIEPGGEMPAAEGLPGGEAGASFRNNPYAPRTWRHPKTLRKAAVLALTPEHLVTWGGGLDRVQRKARTAQAAFKLLQKVQAAALPKLVVKAVKVQEVEPLLLLDYINRFWTHR